MILVVPHHKTRKEAIALIAADDDLFTGVAGSSVEILNQKKEWDGSSMAYSFVGRVGFISVSVSGTLSVDDVNVTVTSDLPAMVKSFVGEEKVASAIEKQLRRVL
jgi:hypothetical protein